MDGPVTTPGSSARPGLSPETGTRAGVAFVIGAGPGVGLETARRFATEGYAVGLVSRNEQRLQHLANGLAGEGHNVAAAAADITDPIALASALHSLTESLGTPDAVCFCPLPDISRIKPVLETTDDDLMASMQLVVAGAARTVTQLVPTMRSRGTGALLFTTGSAGVSPSADRASSAVSTVAAGMYIRLLRQALAKDNIHVAHVVIKGGIGPGLKHQAADVADRVWAQYMQPAGSGGFDIIE